MVDIALKLNPDQAEVDAVVNGLIAYNRAAYEGPSGWQPVAFFLRGEAGEVTGGLSGYALFDWLFVQFLHVPEVLRGRGVGTELMNQAEAWSRERGLIGMWLDTFDFQARPFYEKLGFETFGTLDDHPIGGHRYFMSKRFIAPTA